MVLKGENMLSKNSICQCEIKLAKWTDRYDVDTDRLPYNTMVKKSNSFLTF